MMKSNDFQTNEAINWFRKGPMITSSGSNAQKKAFVNNFIQQFNLDKTAHPNATIDDFIDQYWQKNGWDAGKLSPTYQQSLDNAKQTVTANPTPQAIQQLANTVYSLALMMSKSGSATATALRSKQNTPQPQNTNPAAGDGQLDPNTNQIISKIRSIKNTPEEIDDLVDIIAISMLKLYKIAPKNYKRIVMSLFNNGGKPSMPAASDIAPQSTTAPTQAAPTQAAPISSTQTTPNYSSVKGYAPNSVSYNNNIKATTPTPAQPTSATSTTSTTVPSNRSTPTGGRNAEFTGRGLGRIDPVNTAAADKISQNALDKRINARSNVQKAMTTRAGLPK